MLVAVALGGAAQGGTLSFHNIPGGVITISGHATLGSWRCKTNRFSAVVVPGMSLEFMWEKVSLAEQGTPSDTSLSDEAADSGPARAYVTIPVSSLQCGSAPMRADLMHALKEKKAPYIVFVLRNIGNVTVVPGGKQDQRMHFHFVAVGDLVLAGVEHPVKIGVNVVQTGPTRFELRAEKSLKMTDFGIVPPSALFGLIKAKDQVVISTDMVFDLNARELPVSVADEP